VICPVTGTGICPPKKLLAKLLRSGDDAGRPTSASWGRRDHRSRLFQANAQRQATGMPVALAGLSVERHPQLKTHRQRRWPTAFRSHAGSGAGFRSLAVAPFDRRAAYRHGVFECQEAPAVTPSCVTTGIARIVDCSLKIFRSRPMAIDLRRDRRPATPQRKRLEKANRASGVQSPRCRCFHCHALRTASHRMPAGRRRFESLCPICSIACLRPVQRALRCGTERLKRSDDVVLVGGAPHTPMVRR